MIHKIMTYSPYLSFLGLLVIFKPDFFIIFGQISFFLLIIIMFARPARDLLPNIKFLSIIVRYRKELGIIIGCFGLTHGVGYFVDTSAPLSIILNPNIWSLDSFMAWGFIAFFVSIPLTLTSNIFSMIKMGGKNWKRLQYLAYIMFIATILHIALVSPTKAVFMYSITIVYIFLLVYAGYINKNKKIGKIIK